MINIHFSRIGLKYSVRFVKLFENWKLSFQRHQVTGIGEFEKPLQLKLSDILDKIGEYTQCFTTNKINKDQVVPANRRACKYSMSEFDKILLFCSDVIDQTDTDTIRAHENVLDIHKRYSTLKTQATSMSDSAIPIFALSRMPVKDLQSLYALFKSPNNFTPGPPQNENKDEVIHFLEGIVPHTDTTKPCKKSPPRQNWCESCKQTFSFLNSPHTCYKCCKQFCKKCPLQYMKFARLGSSKPEALCSDCVLLLNRLDAEDWIEASVNFVRAGTLEDVKKAIGCLTMALSLSQNVTKHVLRVARSLLEVGAPQLALILAVPLLQQTSDPSSLVRIYAFIVSILTTLAEVKTANCKTKIELLLAAKEACCLALAANSNLDRPVDLPHLDSKKIDSLIFSLTKQKEIDDKNEVESLHNDLKLLWQSRNHTKLMCVFTTELYENDDRHHSVAHNKTMLALSRFFEGNKDFVEKMLPEDRSAFLYYRGLFNIHNGDIVAGLHDLEYAAWNNHHHSWLRKAVADVLLSVLEDSSFFIFSLDSFVNLCKSNKLLNVFDLKHSERSLRLLLLNTINLEYPCAINWPELTVQGHNVRGHRRFEQAVASQIKEGRWSEWDAALAYIDYIPACFHPAEIALCFVNASIHFLKYLFHVGSSRPEKPKRYALLKLIVSCIINAHVCSVLVLSSGMQMYVSRLCLGVLLPTLKYCKTVATEKESELAIELLQNILHNCRFCPFWEAPFVQLSEAVLLNIKITELQSDYLLGLQHIDPSCRPIKESELCYKLYESDIKGLCCINDRERVRACAMEELLREKGWSWKDVVQLMTSPLSPRDSGGWLIRKPELGVHMEYSTIEGFDIDLDSGSIELLVVPASRSRGGVGLLSQEDIKTMLQLESEGLGPMIFSLDQPSKNEQFHPFQEVRYEPEKLKNTPILHTMFETDYLLKSFSTGAEVSSLPPFSQRPCTEGLTKGLPQQLLAALTPVAERGSFLDSNIHRFWIQADKLVYSEEQFSNKIKIRIGEVEIKVRSHPLLLGPDGKLKDQDYEDDPNSPEAQFASDLTKHYQELSRHFPVFARLKELTKLQLLRVVIHSIWKDLKEKANGTVHVSEEMVRTIQSNAKQQHQTNVGRLLTSLSEQIKRQLPSSLTGISDYSQKIIVTEIVKCLTQALGEQEVQLDQTRLESFVRSWVSGICNESCPPSNSQSLQDFLCSALPVPTKRDIQQEATKQSYQKFVLFNKSVKSLQTPRVTTHNSCKWVPAAILEKNNKGSICYGGVLIAPEFRNCSSSAMSPLPRTAQRVNVQTFNPTNQFKHKPNSAKPFKATTGISSRLDSHTVGGGDKKITADTLPHRVNHIFTNKRGHVNPKPKSAAREMLMRMYVNAVKTQPPSMHTATHELNPQAAARGERFHTREYHKGQAWALATKEGVIKSAGVNRITGPVSQVVDSMSNKVGPSEKLQNVLTSDIKRDNDAT